MIKDPADPRMFDPEIRGVIKKLNQRGYCTTGSCAGHEGLQEGFIAFNKIYPKKNQEEIKQICSGYGCKNVRMTIPSALPEDPNPRTHFAEFSAMGQPKETWFGKGKPRSKGFWKEYYPSQGE